MRELQTIARHAGTVFVGQMAVMAFGIVDTLVSSRYSSEALAALSVGSAIYISVFVALMGVIQAQLPVWAQLRGAGQHLALGRSLRQGLYLALMVLCVGMPVLLFPGLLLEWTGVPAALRSEIERYLMVLALSLPPALLFRLYSTLNQSLGKPLLVTWVQVGGLAAKVPLSIWFVFGGAGLPSMGLVGCAWATLVVNWLMVLIGFWMLRTQDLYTPYRLWQRLERIDWPTMRGFARLGIPTGLSIMVEVSSFTLMALFISRLGTEAAAGHQVASTLCAMLYMMPLALGIAVSARVSYWLGAQKLAHARTAMQLGFKLTLGLSVTCALVLLAVHEPVARLFAGPHAAVALMAASLLPWVAFYHVFDAVQALCVFVLRSYGIATLPLILYSVLLWGVGLGGGNVLAYVGLPGLAPVMAPWAFWCTGIVALALTSWAFMALLRRAVRQRSATA